MLAGVVYFGLLRRTESVLKCLFPCWFLFGFFFLWFHDQRLLFLDLVSQGNNYLKGTA